MAELLFEDYDKWGFAAGKSWHADCSNESTDNPVVVMLNPQGEAK
jgi:hypothetical protein